MGGGLVIHHGLIIRTLWSSQVENTILHVHCVGHVLSRVGVFWGVSCDLRGPKSQNFPGGGGACPKGRAAAHYGWPSTCFKSFVALPLVISRQPIAHCYIHPCTVYWTSYSQKHCSLFFGQGILLYIECVLNARTP